MRYLKVLTIAVLVVGFGSCNYLNYDETTVHTQDDIFSDFQRTKEFLNNIYRHLPHGINPIDGAMRTSASDDAEEVWSLSNIQLMNDGSWSANQPVDAQWSSMYSGIRAANRFLEESERETFEDWRYNTDYDQMMEQFSYYPYEARFLRAYFYFELIRRYGDVPLITTVLGPEEANSVEQSSFEEVVEFIVDECDATIPGLPEDYSGVPQRETGRATSGAAMALKARVLLYAASPLHNPSGDDSKWELAAEAAKDIIDTGNYTLENNYSNVVNNRTSNELIFERRLPASNIFERSNFPVGFEGAEPGTSPTQNLVDSYEMQSTGLAIDEAGSGYNPNNPYTGRDPRLEETVIYNNSIWKGRMVEIWNGGLDGPPRERATRTGYYLKKYVIEQVNLDPGNTTQAIHTWVLFRYGEVLLNYAEAMNEAYGPENAAGLGMTAREAVNMVRNRVNMPEFPAGMSQAGFREKLRNERRVELAFENHRFWDLRRWEIGPSTTEIYGMEITRNNDGSFNYEKELVENRVWEGRMYLYPIPQTELNINENLVQNFNW
ncbi:MAG: RagB/SusD family nutrient uptake outer membrane protein [Balneolaceae bacterium]